MAKRKTPAKQLAPIVRGLMLPEPLLDEVRNLILQTREGMSQTVNAAPGSPLLAGRASHRHRKSPRPTCCIWSADYFDTVP